MSGVVAPAALDVALGLAVEMAWKTAIPLAAALVASHLPGTAAARHQRLVLGWLAVPAVAVGVLVLHGTSTAWPDAPAWPLVVWASASLMGLLRTVWLVRGLYLIPTTPTADGLLLANVESPLTFGWWRPRILLPTGFSTWSDCDQASAQAHERAHIERRDWLVSIAVSALTWMLWFNPVAWLARRRTTLLAELAADDCVLRGGASAVAYAEQLLALSRPHPTASLGLSGSPVVLRVRAALGAHDRSAASLGHSVGVSALFVALAAGIAPLRTAPPPEPVLDCLPADAPPPVLDPAQFPYLYGGP